MPELEAVVRRTARISGGSPGRLATRWHQNHAQDLHKL